MAAPAKMAHVVYMTRRYDEMIDWYLNVFEGRVVHRDPAFSFLTYDDEHHRFAFANMEVIDPEGSDGRGDIGVNHVAYTFASVDDLLDTYERLKAGGIEPYWPVHHGLTLSLYYRDPDGNRMEFQVDCLSPAEARAFTESEAFASNPAGVGFDPDLVLAQRLAGAEHAELLAQPVGPPVEIPEIHFLNRV